MEFEGLLKPSLNKWSSAGARQGLAQMGRGEESSWCVRDGLGQRMGSTQEVDSQPIREIFKTGPLCDQMAGGGASPFSPVGTRMTLEKWKSRGLG